MFLNIRMCSSLVLGGDFVDCNKQWKASGIARENCDLQAQRHGRACPPFPVSVKSGDFFLVAGMTVRNNNWKISKEHGRVGHALCILHYNAEDGILFQFSQI